MNKQLRKNQLNVIAALCALGMWGAPVLASPDQPSGNVGQGAKTWSQECARCHNLRDPKDYRDDQWRTIIKHMRIQASLTGQEARDVLSFLQQSN